MNSVEILGFIGGGLGIFVGVPQSLQVRRLGHGKGVSLVSWTLMFAMYCSWAFYGLRIGSPSTAIMNTITLAVTTSVVVALVGNLPKAIAMLIGLVALDALIILKLPEAIVSALLIVSVFSQMPQVLKSYRNKRDSVRSAVSLQTLQIGITSVFFWITYAWFKHITVMVITSFIAITLSSTILYLEKTNKQKT